MVREKSVFVCHVKFYIINPLFSIYQYTCIRQGERQGVIYINIFCFIDCVPDCTDDPQGEAYFSDKNDCTKFYQCSNGQLVSQSCSPSTYWLTSKCTCVHFNDEICNKDTNRFLSPILSIEKCANASLA